MSSSAVVEFLQFMFPSLCASVVMLWMFGLYNRHRQHLEMMCDTTNESLNAIHARLDAVQREIAALRSTVLVDASPDRLEQLMSWTQEMFTDLIRMRLVTTAPQTAASWLTQERLMKQAENYSEGEDYTEQPPTTRLVHAG